MIMLLISNYKYRVSLVWVALTRQPKTRIIYKNDYDLPHNLTTLY